MKIKNAFKVDYFKSKEKNILWSSSAGWTEQTYHWRHSRHTEEKETNT